MMILLIEFKVLLVILSLQLSRGLGDNKILSGVVGGVITL